MTLLAIDNTLIRVEDVESAYAITDEEHSPYLTSVWFKSGRQMRLGVDFNSFVRAVVQAATPNLTNDIRVQMIALFEEGLPMVVLDE